MKTKILGFVIFLVVQYNVLGQVAASANYDIQTGSLGTTYSWIDCSSGTTIVSGDDKQATFNWPFNFTFYDNSYTTSNNLSVGTNGFIRLDGNASTNYNTASNYSLSASSTELGQIIALAVYDGKIGDNGGWVRYLVTGSSPNRILTVEYNNLEIDYNDNKYADVQVSFYETSNNIVIRLGTDSINKSGVDIGIHSGVENFYDKWQEVLSGTNNTWIEYTPGDPPAPPTNDPPLASWNYKIQTGNEGTTYSWIDCSSGNNIVSGDDTQGTLNWPFNFNFYDNSYNTSNVLSVGTNGFIRLDGAASTNYSTASAYDLTSTATYLGQLIGMGIYDGKIGDNGGWIRSLVTGTAPNRIFTIEYNNYELDYNDNKYADVQVSFYESSNKIVLKLGADNISKSGVDMGLHSGVETYFNKWQEIQSGTNTTWIEYTPPNIEVLATQGTLNAFYPSLKDAFDKINEGTHKGNITIKINKSTTESSSATLNYSGSNNCSYSSVYIYPTVSGLSISGDISSSNLIDLNGADNVTFDGRVNATGSTKDLTIENTSTSGRSTFKFSNSAQNNTIKYCTIKGSQSVNYTGIIWFSPYSNTDNIIENNDITNSNGDRPVNAIYSSSDAGRENSNNIIRNNNIFDFLNHSVTSYGILLSNYSSNWTIEGNNFYETTNLVPTTSAWYYGIRVNNILGNNFSISGNYFGGQAPLCGGSPFTINAATSSRFYAIHLDVGTDTPSSVQGNTIRNFDMSSSNSIPWMGIDVNSGAANIGTINGNIIGSDTGNNNVLLTKSNVNSTSKSYGIYVNSSDTVVVSNNKIGAVTTQSDNLYGHSFYGIFKEENKDGSFIVSHNLVGSLTTSNSIQAITSSTSGAEQHVYGIFSGATGTTQITSNTVANLFNAHSYQYAVKGQVVGISVVKGTNTIQDNTVHHLSNTSPSNDLVGNAAVIGISSQSTTENQSITGNTIYNLESTCSEIRSVNVMGIYYYGGTAGSNEISGNFIHSLDAANTSASLTGIKVYAGSTSIVNNIVNLGVDVSTALTINGLYENGNSGNDNNVWFNSVYIGGTTSGTTASTFALYSVTNNNTRDFRNNILMNARTGGTTGNHYAIRLGGLTNLTIDYNNYYVTGSPALIGQIGIQDKTTFTDWQTATSQDVHSLNIDPVFTTNGGINASDYISAVSLTGITGTGINVDYDGITRSNPPKMGAIESTTQNVWEGTVDTDYANAANWQNGIVPANGADISFAANPLNDCYLDQNRTLKNITNSSAKNLVINAKELTINGIIDFSNGAQINATDTSSVIIFEGSSEQSITTGLFVSNTIDGLILNNDHGLVQNGNLTVESSITLTNGAYSIGANTLTLNGAITSTLGTFIGGSTSNIIFEGSGASTTLPTVELNNLTLNRANGISLGGDVSVDGTLTLTSGMLTIGPNTFTISGNSPTRVTGTIDPSDVSATIELMNTTSITCPDGIFSSSINNLTINGAGINACCSCTINGVIDLQSPNPSSTTGLLNMGNNTLTLGENSTVIGEGEITGIVRREHTFNSNTVYSFGSANTNVTFVDSNLKPTWLSIKTTIGEVPNWNSWTPEGKVQRLYNIARSDNGSTSQAIVNMHYLPSELVDTENESQLVFWHKFTTYNAGLPHEHGKSEQDVTSHTLQVTGLIFGSAASTNLDDSQVAMAYSLSDKNTWKGEVAGHETEWEQAQNWTAGYVPLATDDVLIPGGLTYYPSLTASSNAIVGTLEIEAGATITANSYTLTVKGSGGAWDNQGDFVAGTGKVLFDHGVATEIMTVAGTTNFYDVQIGSNTTLEPVPGSIFRIAGTATGDLLTSRANWNIINSTVEWNGTNQTIINPIALDGSSGYYKLILSGSGTKTMPTTALDIADEFILDGPINVTAQSSISIGNELEILGGATFASGAFNHFVGGHFDVGGHLDEGTFIPTAGYSITLNGTEVQNIYGSEDINFENLIINNSAGVDIFTNITVGDVLTLTNGNLNVRETTLTLNGDVTKTGGFIDVTPQSSLTFTGTTAFAPPASIFFTPPIINNLTINRTGGVVFCCDYTVNGTLNLTSANPSATIGALDMGTNTLTLGEFAVTTGIGDVTGIVKRAHDFLPNVTYTFGNAYTSLVFIDTNEKPTWISIKATIGTIPTWASWTTSGKVKRLYQIASSDNSSTSQAVINMHYLPSELDDSNRESEIIFWHQYTSYGGGLPHEHGKSEQDLINHYLQVTGLAVGSAASTNLADSQIAMAYSLSTKNTWKGEVAGHETEWEQDQNWTAGHAPLSTEEVLIPGGLTYYPSLTASSNAVASTIEIESGASISANTFNLTIYGASGAWDNHGTFIPGTGTVIFNHGVSAEIMTVAGTTNFYNVQIAANTTLEPVSGSIVRIAGTATGDPVTSKANWRILNSTVEWNGTNQNINNPVGLEGNSGYYNLILSGSGIKTMPIDSLHVAGDFTISGTAVANASETIVVEGVTTIDSNTSFNAGTPTHYFCGDLENNGTFNVSTGGTAVFCNGLEQVTISGSSTTNFDNLVINNEQGVLQEANIAINNELTFTNGDLEVGAYTLGINGTISNPGGNIEVSAVSSLSFGGATQFTLNDNLFITEPSINNLTINRSGGVIFGNQSMTVNGTIDLLDGTLTIGSNTLTIAGNAPTRTAGTIDASNIAAIIEFSNTSSIALPSSIFSGNVGNITVSGNGGVISNDDVTLLGILNLEAENPSLTSGSLHMNSSYILEMGADATTIGVGDVTGIVKRAHTFENDTEYSFGSQYTTLNFLNVPGGLKPTWVQCKIVIGTAPTWKSEAINRTYSFAQSGGTDRMIVKLHYLDNELHDSETDESQLVFWDAYDPAFGVNNFVNFYARSFNDRDVNNNWVQLTGPAINYIATSDVLDVKQWGLSYSNLVHSHIWTGNGSPTYDGDWSLPGNWSGGVPEEGCPTLIPNPDDLPADNNGDLNPYRNLLPDVSPAHVNSLEIAAGATLSATDYDITIYGDTDAWVNNGTFIPGTANVIFANGNPENTVEIKGATNFYNITVNDKTWLQPAAGSTIGIKNELHYVDGSILDFSTTNNTIAYTGADQTIIKPNGGTMGYYNLSLSGNGTKTFPALDCELIGDLSLSENALATAINNLVIGTDLTISDASQLTVAPNIQLTVDGVIANSVGTSGLVLSSSKTGTASLIHNTNNVPATIERYISGVEEDWHFLSSPVSNQIISGSDWVPAGTYGNGTGYDLYVWDEPTPCWVYQLNTTTTPNWPTVHPSTNFVPGRGYLYSVQALNPTHSFEGNLNNGSISYPLTANNTEDPLLTGFNLIGNPYPCAIDWKAVTGWTRSNLVDSGGGYDMWIWNPEANNYGVFNSAGTVGTNDVTQYIASMQGFFVRAESNANIVMTNDIRLHTGASNWMKLSNTKYTFSNVKVKITSDAGNGFDEVLVQFGHSENEAGAAKLFSTNNAAPSLYMFAGNQELSVKYLTDTIDNPFIPLAFKPGSNGNYALNIDLDAANFEHVILEDKKSKKLHNLLENPMYQFNSSVNDDPNRFVLHFTEKEAISDSNLSALVYYDGNDIVIDLSLVLEQTDVVIYDMLGRSVINKSLQGKMIHRMVVNSKNQIYIVSAKSGNKIITKKVLVY